MTHVNFSYSSCYNFHNIFSNSNSLRHTLLVGLTATTWDRCRYASCCRTLGSAVVQIMGRSKLGAFPLLYVSDLPAHAAIPHQNCITDWVLCWIWNSASEISPIPALNFTGGDKCEIWLRFSSLSNLRSFGFEIKQHIYNLYGALWGPIIDLFAPCISCGSILQL